MGDDFWKEVRQEQQEKKAKSRMNNTELMVFICSENEWRVDGFSESHYRITDGEFKPYFDYYPTASKARIEGTTKYFFVKDIEKALKDHFKD